MAYVPPHRRRAGAGAPAPPPPPPAGPVTSAGICIYNHPRQTVLIGVDGGYGGTKKQWRRVDKNVIIDNLENKQPRTVDYFINNIPAFPNGGHLTTDTVTAELTRVLGLPGNNPNARTVKQIQDAPMIGIGTYVMGAGFTDFDFVNKYLFPESFVNSVGADRFHLVKLSHNNIELGYALYERVDVAGSFRNGYPHGGYQTTDGMIAGQFNLCNTALREFNEETGFDLAHIPGLPIVNLAPGQPGQPVIRENKLYNRGIINWANGQYSNGSHIGRQINAQSQYYFMIINDAAANSILNAYWGGAPENRAAVMGQGYRYNSELFDLRLIDTNNNLIVNGHTAFVTTQLRTLPNVISAAAGPGIAPGFWGGSIYLHKLQKYQNKLNKN